MNYWLLKSEPEAFSWDDLLSSPRKTTCWDGVRNYQARNYMRDEMKKGDLVFFYHSATKPQAIAGIARVVREAYPDHTQFDPASTYHDPKSSADNPRWMMVDIRAIKSLSPPITIDELKPLRELKDMGLLRRGNRLSVQPVSAKEWQIVLKLRNLKLEEIK